MPYLGTVQYTRADGTPNCKQTVSSNSSNIICTLWQDCLFLMHSNCLHGAVRTRCLLCRNSYWMYATYTLHSWQLRRTYATYRLQTKSLRQDVCHIYVTCRMRYFLTYLLFGRCFEFLSLSTVVHLNIIIIVIVKRKRGGVRHAGPRCNTAVVISSGL